MSRVKVWEWPLRLWHWSLAIAVVTATATGFLETFYAPEVHATAGITVCALLVFRAIWGFMGGMYSRWPQYTTTLRKVIQFIKSPSLSSPHTEGGIVMVWLILIVVSVQAVTGLVNTDDFFLVGPLHNSVPGEVADIGHRVHEYGAWAVLAVVCLHPLAQLIYAIAFRSKLPLSMLSGYKELDPSYMHVESRLLPLVFALSVGALIFWYLY